MTFGQGHDTPLDQGQRMCEILSRSNLAVRSHGLDTAFGYILLKRSLESVERISLYN